MSRLGEDVAGRLQTGRSRNDQDAAADRLYLRDLLLRVAGDLIALQRSILGRAREHAATVMPGYTHFQHAQPWTFGHYLMRQASALDRDLERLAGVLLDRPERARRRRERRDVVAGGPAADGRAPATRTSS